MRRSACLLFICSLLWQPAAAQFPPFTKWYQNPLGFKPVNLHTSSGIILPAAAATAIVLLTKADTTLTRRLTWYEDIGVSYGYYGSRTTMYQNNLGILYPVRRYMSIGAEFNSCYVTDAVNNTWGFGVRPFVRFYPLNRAHFRLFFQSGAGLIYFLRPFPQPSGFFGDYRMGTNLNGCPKYGAGAEFTLNGKLSGQAAIWHVHISNGNHPGSNRNPGHDSNGFSLGLMYRFGK